MRNSLLVSLALHGILTILLLSWPSMPRRSTRPINVYPVELIRAAQLTEAPARKKEELKTVPQLQKQKEPAVSVVKKPPKKHAETKMEAPSKAVPAAESSAVGSSGLKIDTKDFPFAYYLAIMQNRIQRNWQPPYQTAATSDKLTAIIRFQVLRNGNIINVKIEQSSNRYLFDQAAQRAVYSADPLPPLPDDFLGELLSVIIEFEGL